MREQEIIRSVENEVEYRVADLTQEDIKRLEYRGTYDLVEEITEYILEDYELTEDEAEELFELVDTTLEEALEEAKEENPFTTKIRAYGWINRVARA